MESQRDVNGIVVASDDDDDDDCDILMKQHFSISTKKPKIQYNILYIC